jgi:outer membrane protein OmpU
MKKILIATTALAMTATVAAAEIKFSGDARMGLQYNGATVGASKTRLEKRMTVNIDGSTTADNGVTFGARLRLRSDENTGSAVAGARVFARAGGLTVAAGNILGAFESMPGLYAPSVGLTGLGWSGLIANVDRGGATHDAGYFDWDSYSSRGNGAEGIEAIYSAGDFTVHLSHSSDDLRGAVGTAKRTGVYASYVVSGWTLALGLQDGQAATGVDDKIVLTAGGKIGDFGVGVGVASNGKGANEVTKFAVNGSYTMGATTLSAYIAQQDVLPVVGGSKSSFGIGASYNMGGGARLTGGIERTTRKDTRADLGVSFSF